jgi:GTP-binding protein Era
MAPVGERCGTVAIVGRPNVGKSTLLNRLLGQKLAITSHKAQTTRHAILGVKSRGDGQILYVDTPGLHQRGGSALNRMLNRTARASLADVDVILYLIEAGRFTDEDQHALDAIAATDAPVVAAVNKVDRVKRKESLLPFLAELGRRYAFAEVVPISAQTGDQVALLEDRLLALLPEGAPIYPEDQLTDRSERFFAAELLREQLTRRYAKELPYAVTVEIERFEDLGDRYLIHALIWVEREGQKAIIIGSAGAALKATATEARKQMQRMFGCPVHLEVWVKVKQSWSSDEAALVSLGYSD